MGVVLVARIEVEFRAALTTLAAFPHAVCRLLMSSVGVARQGARSAGAHSRIRRRCIVAFVEVAGDLVGDGVEECLVGLRERCCFLVVLRPFARGVGRG